MGATKTIEARIVIAGEDRGASAAVANVVKTVRQLEDAAKVSKPMQDVARALDQVERASKAADAALKGRAGLSQAEAGLKATRGAAEAAAKALDDARRARAAFEGVKAARGSEQAKQIEAATKAVRDYTAAHKRAEADVKRATAAVEAEAATLRSAEAAAKRFGADLGNLESHQQRLRSATESATNAVRAQIRVEDQAARAAAHHAREEAERLRHMRAHGAIGVAASAAAGYVGVHSVAHEIGSSVKAGARYQHEVVALQNAGRTAEEMREISHASDATVRAVPTATFEENLKVINETTGAFGSLHHAIENLTFMQKSSAALHAAAGDKIHDGPGELGNKLARFFEMRGTAGNTEVFQREAGEMIRAMVFTRGNFNPAEMVNFAQQAKASLPLYNERFLSKIVPSLVTEFGGDRAGTAANAFRGVVMGKANDKKQAEEWVKLGLLDPKLAIMKGGHAVSWKAGAVKDTNLALSDPLQWAETVLLPALRKKGVNVDDKLELSKALGTLFRNSNSNLFAETLTQKLSRTRLHKDEENINKAGTLDEVYARNLKEDPTESLKAVKAGIENLLTTASSPLMTTAAAGLKSLAEGLQSIAVAAKDNPGLAVAGGVTAGAAGLGAAGYASYKLMTGFGLPAAAGELTVAAKMLQAAAIEKGVDPKKVLATSPLVGLGLTGVGIGLAGAAGVAGYATAKEMPKIAETEGPAAIDPATGEHLDTKVPETTPWVRNWIMSWFTKPEVTDEAGKAVGAGIGKGIVDAPLPPRRPAMLEDFKTKADETGTEAGKTLLQRITEAVGAGIMMPINFVPGSGGGGGGAGGGLIQKASFSPGGGLGGGGGSGGGGGLGGLGAGIPRFGGSGGGVGGGSGGSGGGSRVSGAPMPGIPSSVDMTDAERNMLGLIQKYESHGGNTLNYVGRRQGISPLAARGYTAQGYFQILNSNWRRLAPKLGITAPNAMAGTLEEQTRVALALLRSAGGRPKDWAPFNPALRAAIARGERAPLAGITAKDAAAAEPRLVKGLDGKEGLDLGNGTMRMPDGSIRSITQGSGLTIPTPPPGGLGGAGSGGRADLSAAAERMHAAAERFEQASFRGQIEVVASGGVRAKGMRIRSRGAVSADMGVSMPGAKESDDDWV